jgi:hypothetical protein
MCTVFSFNIQLSSVQVDFIRLQCKGHQRVSDGVVRRIAGQFEKEFPEIKISHRAIKRALFEKCITKGKGHKPMIKRRNHSFH